jgi:hypothetical protein
MTTIQRLASRRWRVSAQPFRVRTLDGIWVAGTRLGDASKDDHLFPHDEAVRLFEGAGEPKRLLLAERFGHAEDGLSLDLAGRLARSIHRGWEPAWPG